MRDVDRHKLIDKLVAWSVFSSASPSKVGAAVKQMKKEDRDRLKYLTSDDFKKHISVI